MLSFLPLIFPPYVTGKYDTKMSTYDPIKYFSYTRHPLTCGRDTVKPDKSIKAGSSAWENTADAKWHEPSLSQIVRWIRWPCVTTKKERRRKKSITYNLNDKQMWLYMTRLNNGALIARTRRIHLRQTYFPLELLLRISAGFSCQFLRDPLIRPAITTNSNTSTLTQVNTLFTIADSFTPNANKPETIRRHDGSLRSMKRAGSVRT